MMYSNAERLAAKVRAANRAYALALEVQAKLRPIFDGLRGKQVVKQDGKLLERVARMLPSLNEVGCEEVIHYRGYGSKYLIWLIRTSSSSGVGHEYHEVLLYIGETEGNILVRLCNPLTPEDARSDYTVEELLRKREAYLAAKALADRAKSNLYPFAEILA